MRTATCMAASTATLNWSACGCGLPSSTCFVRWRATCRRGGEGGNKEGRDWEIRKSEHACELVGLRRLASLLPQGRAIDYTPMLVAPLEPPTESSIAKLPTLGSKARGLGPPKCALVRPHSAEVRTHFGSKAAFFYVRFGYRSRAVAAPNNPHVSWLRSCQLKTCSCSIPQRSGMIEVRWPL